MRLDAPDTQAMTTTTTPDTVLIKSIGQTYVYGPERDPWGSGTYHIVCLRCGENTRYALREFTTIEAERHERYCKTHKEG